MLSLLRRFGISTLSEDASNYGLSLTLGGGEVTLIELTNAFAVFANQGNYVPVTSILMRNRQRRSHSCTNMTMAVRRGAISR